MLAQQILKAPDYPDYQAILGDRTALLGIQKEDNILYLNFNREYSAAKPSREILCRAALAKTFTQIPGIDYISINCDGQPLWDSHGNPVGAFSGSDFVESVSDVNSFERVELKLYFANEAGDSLVPETRELVHNISTSMEKLVVEQLLAGPQGGAGAVLPKDTKILNVSLTDGVCYVNLDGSFLNGNPDMAEYIPVYALVNSLTELQTVTKVQITVAGSADGYVPQCDIPGVAAWAGGEIYSGLRREKEHQTAIFVDNRGFCTWRGRSVLVLQYGKWKYGAHGVRRIAAGCLLSALHMQKTMRARTASFGPVFRGRGAADGRGASAEPSGGAP